MVQVRCVGKYASKIKLKHGTLAVPSLRGYQGGMPPYRLLVPPFRYTQNTFFEISHSLKISDSDVKRNNNAQA